jgi:hypothetical protein
MKQETSIVTKENNKVRLSFVDLFVVIGVLFFYVIIGIFAFVLLKCNDLITFLKKKHTRSITTDYHISGSVLVHRESFG